MPLQDTDPTPSFGGFGLRESIMAISHTLLTSRVMISLLVVLMVAATATGLLLLPWNA